MTTTQRTATARLALRPTIACLAAVTAVAASTAPTGTTTASTDATPVRLSYAYDGLFSEPFNELETMAQATGVDLRLELAGADYEELDQRVQSDLLAGSPPGVSMMGLNRVRPYVEAGRVLPLDALIENDPDFDLSQYDAEFLDLMTYDGQLYGLPLAVSTPIIYINTELFTAAGLDPEDVPDTWEEVTAAAQTVVDGGVAEHGVYIEWGITGNWMIQALVESAGGAMLSADESEVALDEPEAVAAITFLTDLVQGELMQPLQADDGRETFLNGQSAMLITSTAFLGNVIDAGVDTRTGVLPIPDGHERRTPAGGNGLVILATDEAEQQAAWEVLKLFTGIEGSTVITRATGYMPVNRLAATSADHLAPDLEDPNRATSLAQIETLVPWVQFPGQNGAEITDVINNEVFAAMTGEKSPQAAMDDAAEQVEALLP